MAARIRRGLPSMPDLPRAVERPGKRPDASRRAGPSDMAHALRAPFIRMTFLRGGLPNRRLYSLMNYVGLS